jgi:hypothetical protein
VRSLPLDLPTATILLEQAPGGHAVTHDLHNGGMELAANPDPRPLTAMVAELGTIVSVWAHPDA